MMMSDNYYVFFVTYKGTMTDKVVVEAETEEEAKRLVREGSIVEVLDTVDEERDEILDIR